MSEKKREARLCQIRQYLSDHYMGGENFRFDMDETEAMECHKKAFTVTHNEEELLGAYYSAEPIDGKSPLFMTAGDIQGRLINWGSIRNPMPLNRFGSLLRRNGFVMKRPGGRKGYIVYEKTYSEDQRRIADEILSAENDE